MSKVANMGVKTPETFEEAMALADSLKEENAQKDALIKEQAEEIAKLEGKLKKAEVRPTVTVKKKQYIVMSGANWEGVDYTPEELAENEKVCEAILNDSPKSSIFKLEE